MPIAFVLGQILLKTPGQTERPFCQKIRKSLCENHQHATDIMAKHREVYVERKALTLSSVHVVTWLRVQQSQVVVTNSIYIGMEVQYSMTNLSNAPSTFQFIFSPFVRRGVVAFYEIFMSAGPSSLRPPPSSPAPPPDLNCKF